MHRSAEFRSAEPRRASSFAVIEAVRCFKGPPTEAERIADDGLSAALAPGLVARWPDGTEVSYNATYTRNQGFHGRSWSLMLRPDVALWSPTGPSRGLHLLDAKFKLVGSLDGDDEAQGRARRDDLHKMHAYRDAIPEARSAWVMFPGTTSRHWEPGDAPGLQGVGAVPVVPGEDQAALRTIVGRMLGAEALAASPEAA
ncbi:MAG: nuclease domain-containing protein [Phycisphaerales bacterium]